MHNNLKKRFQFLRQFFFDTDLIVSMNFLPQLKIKILNPWVMIYKELSSSQKTKMMTNIFMSNFIQTIPNCECESKLYNRSFKTPAFIWDIFVNSWVQFQIWSFQITSERHVTYLSLNCFNSRRQEYKRDKCYELF